MSFSAGSVYHDLTLLQLCGSGAFGEVWLCRDISRKKLAVKIISKGRLGEFWRRELQGVINYRTITEQTSGLLQIYHVGEDEDFFYYTMEAADSLSQENYVPDTLSARLAANGPLPPETLQAVLKEIFNGIKVIHQAGFAHRDIKPDNIIFVHGKPRIGDIGLISALSATMSQLAGTLEFLPPELRSSDSPDQVDRKSRQGSDLYAFGKVVYCAVTGEEPQKWPAIPCGIPLSLPLKFYLRLSMQLCDRNPARRLHSLDELEHEMGEIERKLLFGETFRDKIIYFRKTAIREVIGATYQVLRWFRRHWYLGPALVCAFVCSIILAWPKKPFDLADQKTQKYVNTRAGISMTIPKQWSVLSPETFLSMLKGAKTTDLQQLEQLKAAVENGMEMIICDIDRIYFDNITVVPQQKVTENPTDIPLDELRLKVQTDFASYGVKSEIHEVRKIVVQGKNALMVDATLFNSPKYKEGCRVNIYRVMKTPELEFSITLSSRHKTYQKRKEEFEAVLKTLEFLPVKENQIQK